MAGLLDAIFDPSLYNGSGGLLSRLSPMIGGLPQSAGFQNSLDQRFAPANEQPLTPFAGSLPIGDYQMPRIGTQVAFAPQTPTDVSSQGRQQPAQAAPQIGPAPPRGFFDRFNSGLQSIGNGGSVIGALTGNYTDPQTISQQNQTKLFDAYKSAGLSPAQAYIAAMQPKIGENLLGGGLTDDIKEYNFAKREDPNLTFEKFMARKKAVSGEYGMTPIWGTGPDGKPAVLQLGKSGDAKQSILPPGFNLARDPIKVEGPTGTTILDPQTRQQVGFIPKDVAGAQAAEKRGQAQGTAQAALANGADIDAEQTKNKIDALLKNEGLNSIVGPIDQFRPSWTLGQSGRDALARLEQLQGGAFLQAYSTLKGGGAITEMEGQKAEKAIARMQRSQSEEDFRAALRDFRDAIDIGLQKLRRAANGGTEPTTPSTGSNVDALLKKYGG